MKKGCLIFLGVCAVLALIAVGVVLYIDRDYGFLVPAGRIEHTELVELYPSVRAAIDPQPAVNLLRDTIEQQTGQSVPLWLINWCMPYGASAIVGADKSDSSIHVHFLLNARRLGPLLARALREYDITKELDELTWSKDGVTLERRGALTLSAVTEMDPEAEEAVWLEWSRTIQPKALTLEGGHFVEVIADNRSGGAYLAVASLMRAFDYELSADEQKIGRSSLKFVNNARMHLDIHDNDRLEIYVRMEIIPEFKDRVGVINLKIAIDEIFEAWQTYLKDERDITLEGGSVKNEEIIEWRYTLDNASDVLRDILNGLNKPGAGATNR